MQLSMSSAGALIWPTLLSAVPTLRQKRLNTAGEGAHEGGEREASAGNEV